MNTTGRRKKEKFVYHEEWACQTCVAWACQTCVACDLFSTWAAAHGYRYISLCVSALGLVAPRAHHVRVHTVPYVMDIYIYDQGGYETQVHVPWFRALSVH